MLSINSTLARWIWLTLSLAVLIGGFWFWSRDLSADAPINFSGFSQALATDPPLYTYHAKNRVYFGQADPLGDRRWILFEKSFAGWLETLWFESVGVSIAHGRQVGVVLTFVSILLLLGALWQSHRGWVAPATSVALVVNVILMTYGSFPFLEISLLFFASLAFFFYATWGNRWWGVVLSAMAISAATFWGKIFGVLLLPPLIFCVMSDAENGAKIRSGAIVVGTFVITGIVLAFLLYGSQVTAAAEFLKEQSYQSRAFPEALTSPWSFIAFLLAYGFRNDLYFVSVDLLGFLFVSAVLLALWIQFRKTISTLRPRTTRLVLGWVVCIWIGLAIPSYSPPRYSLIFIPALVILCFTLIDSLIGSKIEWPKRLNWWSSAIVGVAGWVVAMQLGLANFSGHYVEGLYTQYMVSTLPIAVGVVLLVRYVGQFATFTLRPVVLITIGILLVGGSVAAGWYNYSSIGIGYRTYQIREVDRDLQFILGPKAVVSGPYAAAFTQENKVLSHIHFFGESWSDSSVFVELPITHLAVDESNFKSAVAQSKSLESAKPITSYWIGGHEVSIFDISRLYDNPAANAYRPGVYEQAVQYFERFNFDSALLKLGEDPELINRSRSAALLYARSLFKADLDDAAINNYQVLCTRYPADFAILREAANAIHQISEVRYDTALYQIAAIFYQRAEMLNQWEAENLQRLASETHQYFENLRQSRRQAVDSSRR